MRKAVRWATRIETMYASSLNRCNLPPWAIASRHYNRHPQPLEIQGVRHNGRPLFEKLDKQEDPDVRCAVFHDFMDVRFQLHQWQQEGTVNSRKSLKNSYLRFLRGWLFDSNAIEGAVLKGWATVSRSAICTRRPIFAICWNG